MRHQAEYFFAITKTRLTSDDNMNKNINASVQAQYDLITY
jgi:hypothetical protein